MSSRASRVSSRELPHPLHAASPLTPRDLACPRALSQSRYSSLKAGDAVFFNMNTLHAGTANYPIDEGGGQRLLFILTFRNRKGKKALGHAPNLRPHYRDRGITLNDMREQLAMDHPFGGANPRDGRVFGDGLSVPPVADAE